jgi:tryptophan synthase alpha subunit
MHNDWTDYPVLVAFSVGADRYLLETKASAFDRHLSRDWPSMGAQALQAAVRAALMKKIWLGPIDSPDDITAALDEYRHEGWYVIGLPGLTDYAVKSRAARYPDGCVPAIPA